MLRSIEFPLRFIGLDDHKLGILQARRQGGGGGVRGMRTHPPGAKKCPPDGIVKDLNWYKTNVVMVGLTISMHFQQFEDLKFLFCPGSMPPDTPKTFAECPTVPNWAGLSRFYLRIPNPDSTSVGRTRVSQFWRTALTSQRTEKYIFVKLS